MDSNSCDMRAMPMKQISPNRTASPARIVAAVTFLVAMLGCCQGMGGKEKSLQSRDDFFFVKTRAQAVHMATQVLARLDPPITNVVPVIVREESSAFVIVYPLFYEHSTNVISQSQVIVNKKNARIKVKLSVPVTSSPEGKGRSPANY